MAGLKDLANAMSLSSPARDDKLLIAAIAESMGLMHSISHEYVEDITKAATAAITVNGNGLADLVPYVSKRMDLDQNAASLIALDLTRKIFSNYNKQQMLALGLKKFEWLHTGDTTCCQDHIPMSGKIYEFAEPPVISPTGQRGFPSDLADCKCKILAVIEF